MTSYLMLYTEPPTRRLFENERPGRLIFASDEVTAADRDVYDECIELPPITDLEGTLDALSDARADRVIAQTEYGLLPAALMGACDRMAAFLCTNKWMSRCTLAREGVLVPRFALVENAAQIRASGLRYPLVLKPVASTLGRHVLRVDADYQLDMRVGAIKTALPTAVDIRRCAEFARLAKFDMGCDPTRQFIVEEFIDAPAFEMDGYVLNGRIENFGVIEQVTSAPPRFFIEGYKLPADGVWLDDAHVKPIHASRLSEMGFAIEFRGSRVIEVNGRLGEDAGFPDLFRAAVGEAPILSWMAGKQAPAQAVARAAIAYYNRYETGRVKSVDAPPGVTVLVKPGDLVDMRSIYHNGPHVAYAIATHAISSHAAYGKARGLIQRTRIEFE